MQRQQKITLGEMRSNNGPTRLIVYCSDFNALTPSSWIPPLGAMTYGCRIWSLGLLTRPAAGGALTSGRCSNVRTWERASYIPKSRTLTPPAVSASVAAMDSTNSQFRSIAGSWIRPQPLR
jgi:hypothetical protein